MKHDELLAKLTPTQERGFPSNPITVLNTLRAVVELHKPELHQNDNVMACIQCSSFSFRYVAHPCPSIQAIEKELG
jgi:hypothetical protein